MNRRQFLLAAAASACPALAARADSKLDAIDGVVGAALERGDAPGAVVVVSRAGRTVWRKAYGRRSLEPERVEMTADAVFDLASLTKPLATAASVLALADDGKLRVGDPAARHWPDFAAEGKDAVTLEHLLLHTAGLIADNPLSDYEGEQADALTRVAGLKLQAPPGTRFRYSDVGFIVLGEVVRRVSGETPDRFARRRLFEPLGMADTTYLPGEALRARCVPTEKRAGRMLVGEVHDPRAAQLGGVAGHAGLFGTADDVARFADVLLAGGERDGRRVLSAEAVKLLTTPRPVPGGLRTLGFDADTSYSSPRGGVYAAGRGFGHTGFTGTSLWVDVPSRTAIVLLTSRLHPAGKGNVTRLRRELADAVAVAI